MIDERIKQIGMDIHALVEDHEMLAGRSEGPVTLTLQYGTSVSFAYDPMALDNGFVLRLRALTSEGWMDAAFNPDGRLSRGLIGNTLVMDADRLIEVWNRARENKGAAGHEVA